MQSRTPEELQQQITQLQTFQLVLTGLASSTTFNSGSLDASLREVTQTIAEALHAAFCSVWKTSDDIGLYCHCRYDLSKVQFSSDRSQPLKCPAHIEKAFKAGQTISLHRSDSDRCSAMESSVENWIGSPILYNGDLWGLLVVADVTKQRSIAPAEIEFLKHVAALIPLALLAVERLQAQTALSHAKEQAERASQTKAQFLANMSHEIRTPLTAIIGFAESLNSSDQTMEERIDAIQAITRNGKHLQNLVSDILDFSKLEAKRLEVENRQIVLASLLKDLCALGQAQAHDKGIEFAFHYMYPLPRVIHSDPTRIKQILLNLINNAVKFTAAPGAVRLIVSYQQPENQLMLGVQDTGIGIAEDVIEHLFAPFSQADGSITRKHGGTGLGLAISRELAKRLHGDIQVISTPGLGSLFVVTLPTGDLGENALIYEGDPSFSQPTEQAATVIRAQHLAGTVMVADDNHDNQKLISLMIKRTGADVVIANNGQEAVENAQVQEIDLILMDLQMPVMSGLQATEMLRLTGFDQPIVALTANATATDRAAALEAGCDDFLSKPIDQQTFYSTLARYLPASKPPSVTASDISELQQDPEYQQLRAEFYHELPDRIAAIGNAIEQQDWPQVRTLAHQLRGIAGSFGIPEATRLAGALEFQAVREDHGEILFIFNNLKSLCATQT